MRKNKKKMIKISVKKILTTLSSALLLTIFVFVFAVEQTSAENMTSDSWQIQFGNFNVTSGNPNGSVTIETSSSITNDAAAYTVITRMTFLRFSSCQNERGLSAFSGI